MMKVFEATDENCMKALGQILYEQRAYGDVVKAAEVTVEIEIKGTSENPSLLEGQKVMKCIRDLIPEDAAFRYRMEDIDVNGEGVHIILLIKEEESMVRRRKSAGCS